MAAGRGQLLTLQLVLKGETQHLVQLQPQVVAEGKADLQELETQPVDLVEEAHLTTELLAREQQIRDLMAELLAVMGAEAAAAPDR